MSSLVDKMYAMQIVDDLLVPQKKEQGINLKNGQKNNDSGVGMRQVCNDDTNNTIGSRFSNNRAKNSPQTSSPRRRKTLTKDSAWLIGERSPTLANERRDHRHKRRLNRFTFSACRSGG